jgi:hypothetical protein
MGFTTYAQDKILNAYGQNSALAPPATHHIGLLKAVQWASTTGYAVGAYAIPSAFGSIGGDVGKIFKCTTAGTSGSSEPSWPTSAGGTVVDGTVTWTEVSILFESGSFTGAEISGANYSRASVTASSTNFPAASSAQPAVLENGTAISFPSPSADWGLVVGWIDSDAASGGNIWAWGAMTSALDAPSGSNPAFGVNGLQLSMTV